MSLAWAIAEYLHDDVQALTLFATHYHELTRLAEMLPGCRNHKAIVEEIGGEIVFLHRIEEAPSRSYGVHVARLAGLPRQVTDRAGEILSASNPKASRTSPGSAVKLFPSSSPMRRSGTGEG